MDQMDFLRGPRCWLFVYFMKFFLNSMDLSYSVFHTNKNSVMFVAFLGPYVGYWLFGDASYYSGFQLMSVSHL